MKSINEADRLFKAQYKVKTMMLKSREKSQKGATLVEYCVLVALICIATITSVRTLGESIDDKLRFATEEVSAAGGTTPP